VSARGNRDRQKVEEMCVDDGGRRSTINLIQYLVKKEDAEKLKGGGEREKIEI
jgi:hypothetical protein